MAATLAHCVYCFDCLLDSVGGGHIASYSSDVPSFSTEKFPLFITWKKRGYQSSSDWRLRGCIGTFSPKDLSKGLKEYALTSALKDSRFSPVRADEIELLKVDVSLLTNFETAANIDDWVIGKHGITIEFSESSRSYSATYLPEVASEQRWTRSKTLEELIAKSGYRGSASKVLKSPSAYQFKLTRYQSSKIGMSYSEYLAYKQNAKEAKGSANASSSSASSASSSASASGMDLSPKHKRKCSEEEREDHEESDEEEEAITAKA